MTWWPSSPPSKRPDAVLGSQLGAVAAEGDPLDDAVLVAEVADDRVLRGPVVPEAEVAGVPVVAHA